MERLEAPALSGDLTGERETGTQSRHDGAGRKHEQRRAQCYQYPDRTASTGSRHRSSVLGLIGHCERVLFAVRDQQFPSTNSCLGSTPKSQP